MTVCPYCKESLKKEPSRKTKCPHCGNFIFVRTHPHSGERILVREDELDSIENEWQKVNRKNDVDRRLRSMFRHDYDAEKIALRKKFGKEPLDYDIFWSLAIKGSVETAFALQWGQYRNYKSVMARILFAEEKYNEALTLQVEVLYLDYNNPTNHGAYGQQFIKEKPNIVPAQIENLIDIAKAESLTMDALLCRFIKDADAVKKYIPILPHSPEEALKEISKELKMKW